MKTLRIILHFSSNSFQQMLSNIPVFLIFFLSKLVRYSLFLFFLVLLFNGVTSVMGYSREQMLMFYLIFNVIDTTAQMMFREVYRFRPLIVSGGFDAVLTKPFSPIIRSLFGGPDFIDLGLLVIIISVSIYVTSTSLHPTFFQVILTLAMIINSLLIAAAFHIAVLGIGVISLSVDHLVMIFRDLTALMRIPVDMFTNPIRSILTFVLPVGIMFTFPAKALFGLLNWQLVLISFIFGGLSLYLSLKFWHYSLRQYQSASS